MTRHLNDALNCPLLGVCCKSSSILFFLQFSRYRTFSSQRTEIVNEIVEIVEIVKEIVVTNFQ